MSQTAQKRAEDFKQFKHYAALAFLVAAPVIIALPPRKFDLYTASLGAAFIVSANHIATERTGKGIVSHMASYLPTKKPGIFRDLPTDKAEELSVRMQLAKVQERELEKLRGDAVVDENEIGLKGVAKKIWMGNETEGWEERRLEEERKALAEGKGYADLILDYVKEAWRMDEGDKEGVKNKEEEKDKTR
ncbi:uncharacterized protein GIQ15_02625 [Arthroderma uncinatum]|uniref:uncharacterized protein n=1 Tax=Arthroderma uncinatum TaxID=74035 RepID=UPI00144AFA45|nr:uncharacterized protein GIQ15_02625 [Arthroderma uncinatum]KAF3483301.1 hypothetical protein GIQ15_02625 [Arthroderma uncinatum]